MKFSIPLAMALASALAAASENENVKVNLAHHIARQTTTSTTPTNTTGCVQHGDHWHCDEPAANSTTSAVAHDDHDHEEHAEGETEAEHAAHADEHDHEHEAATNATVAGNSTSHADDEHAGCHKHGDEWHCEEEETGGTASAAGSNEDNANCVIHIGHTHGSCSQQQKCSGTLGAYDMPLHIGSVFIILVASGLGVALPLIAQKMRAKSNKEGIALFLARHFGTGIIIATAFVHLLYHGFAMFASECLDGLLHYESTAPALAMAAAIITFLFDLIGARGSGGAGHGHDGHVHGVVGGGGEAAIPSEANSTTSEPEDGGEKGRDVHGDHTHSLGHDHGHSHSHSHDHEEPVSIPMCTHSAGHTTQDGWQVIMLEAGIIFHSIMIGITLGAGSGAGWSTLLIVVVFHQFFEGAALGARIALLCVSNARALIMGLAFALVTPIGVGIGIGVRNALATNPREAMIAVGVLNSLSAGILLYTAFRLLSVDFIDGPLRRASIPRVLAAVGAMTVGMIAMSVLGKWA